MLCNSHNNTNQITALYSNLEHFHAVGRYSAPVEELQVKTLSLVSLVWGQSDLYIC